MPAYEESVVDGPVRGIHTHSIVHRGQAVPVTVAHRDFTRLLHDDPRSVRVRCWTWAKIVEVARR